MVDRMDTLSHRVSSAIAAALWAASALPFILTGDAVVPTVVQLVLVAALSAVNFKVGLPQRNEIVAFSLAWAALHTVWLITHMRIALIVAQLVVAGMCLFVIFLSHPKRYADRTPSSKAAFAAALLACAALQVGIVLLMISYLDVRMSASGPAFDDMPVREAPVRSCERPTRFEVVESSDLGL
ncbi:hypothetical protein JI75_07745 [Berryella intestinalis]|uniref:Uncharacterized protein n=1 Tax=Berryella intestinalis TaxID=1531429 RepID=A0A0A8B5H4_9ACTN|nr:hypothetical protein [Berryella intestinalis]AJC12564.1 hypothetical protein JI75_07745 [Berryella intestinalis]